MNADSPKAGRNQAMRVKGSLLCLLSALLLLAGACDEFFPNEAFKPTGSPFYLEPALALLELTGGQQPLPTGTYTIDITCRATGGAPVTQQFPAGLQFISTRHQVQHVIMLKPQTAEFGTEETRRSLGVFCGNRYRRTPDRLDTFELGPVTDNRELQEIAALVRDRNITANLWMVQRAVWMITDSTGLNQIYRDSLAALPPEGYQGQRKRSKGSVVGPVCVQRTGRRVQRTGRLHLGDQSRVRGSEPGPLNP